MKKLLSISVGLMLAAAPLKADTFKVCFEPWAPYAEKVTETTAQGITAEFLTEVFLALGHKLELIEIDSNVRGAAEAMAGRMDGVLFCSPGQLEGIICAAMSQEYWLIAAIVSANSPLSEYTGIADFKGKTVGTVNGYEYPESISQFPDMQQEDVPVAESNLRKLTAGRIDVIFDDPVWAQIEAKKMGAEIKVLRPLVAHDPTFLGLNSKHAELMKQVDAKAAELIQAGLLDSLYKKHVGMDLKTFMTTYEIPAGP